MGGRERLRRADNRGAILAQSMLFVVSAGFFMWFLGSLRSYLIEAEGATGRLSTLTFAAGSTRRAAGYGWRPQTSAGPVAGSTGRR